MVVKITFHLEIIQVLGSVAIEESHNFNCITFFSYSVTVTVTINWLHTAADLTRGQSIQGLQLTAIG